MFTCNHEQSANVGGEHTLASVLELAVGHTDYREDALVRHSVPILARQVGLQDIPSRHYELVTDGSDP